MPQKSTRAFRTISEASEELELKPHVLRFWEAKFSDLKPLTRGGGRRFYRPEDIDFLRGLRILLHDEKHKIKDVQKLIKLRGAQSVSDLGQSAGIKRPSRPIEERDLVPERIKAAVPAPEPAPIPKPVPISAPDTVVPFKAAPTAPAPAAIPVAPVALAVEPVQPDLDKATSDKLEGALERLSSLRSRWEKFT